jgi:hypothetical protein
LGIVEGDDLRPADSQQILLETWRDIDGGDRPPGANRPGGALQIIGAFGDAQTWRRRDRLDELGQDLGAVGIDDDDVKPRTTALLKVQVRIAKAISGTTILSK